MRSAEQVRGGAPRHAARSSRTARKYGKKNPQVRLLSSVQRRSVRLLQWLPRWLRFSYLTALGCCSAWRVQQSSTALSTKEPVTPSVAPGPCSFSSPHVVCVLHPCAATALRLRLTTPHEAPSDGPACAEYQGRFSGSAKLAGISRLFRRNCVLAARPYLCDKGNPTVGLDRQLPVNEAGLAVWQGGGQVLMMRSVDVVEIGNSRSFCHARNEDKPRRCAGLVLSDRASSRRVPGAGGGEDDNKKRGGERIRAPRSSPRPSRRPSGRTSTGC